MKHSSTIADMLGSVTEEKGIKWEVGGWCCVGGGGGGGGGRHHKMEMINSVIKL